MWDQYASDEEALAAGGAAVGRGKALPAERRVMLDSANNITVYAQDMRRFLNESELNELLNGSPP